MQSHPSPQMYTYLKRNSYLRIKKDVDRVACLEEEGVCIFEFRFGSTCRGRVVLEYKQAKRLAQGTRRDTLAQQGEHCVFSPGTFKRGISCAFFFVVLGLPAYGLRRKESTLLTLSLRATQPTEDFHGLNGVMTGRSLRWDKCGFSVTIHIPCMPYNNSTCINIFAGSRPSTHLADPLQNIPVKTCAAVRGKMYVLLQQKHGVSIVSSKVGQNFKAINPAASPQPLRAAP